MKDGGGGDSKRSGAGIAHTSARRRGSRLENDRGGPTRTRVPRSSGPDTKRRAAHQSAPSTRPIKCSRWDATRGQSALASGSTGPSPPFGRLASKARSLPNQERFALSSIPRDEARPNTATGVPASRVPLRLSNHAASSSMHMRPEACPGYNRDRHTSVEAPHIEAQV